MKNTFGSSISITLFGESLPDFWERMAGIGVNVSLQDELKTE